MAITDRSSTRHRAAIVVVVTGALLAAGMSTAAADTAPPASCVGHSMSFFGTTSNPPELIVGRHAIPVFKEIAAEELGGPLGALASRQAQIRTTDPDEDC